MKQNPAYYINFSPLIRNYQFVEINGLSLTFKKRAYH